MRKLLTENNIKELLMKAVNAQDRVLILLFYKNICNDSNEATNIKVDDIDFEKNTINVNGRVMKFDSTLGKELKACIKSTRYHFIKEGTNNRGYYDFNMNSPYLIKTKPTIRNNQGVNPLSYDGVRSKFKILETILGEKLSVVDLITNGAINGLLAQKKSWSLKEIEKFLKENNIKLSTYRVYNLLKFCS